MSLVLSWIGAFLVKKRIPDMAVLRLIRAYLDAGIMDGGVVVERQQGTPQGGPLSPLLANVLLDEVDKALQARGYCFARYADDANVYAGSRRAGEWVMAWLRSLYGKLKLQINEAKSAVCSALGRKFLGYELWVAMTLPLLPVALSNLVTRRLGAVPRASVAQIAWG